VGWSAHRCFAPYAGVGIDTTLTPFGDPIDLGGTAVQEWQATADLPSAGEVENGDLITIDEMPGFDGFAPSPSLGLDSDSITDSDGGTWDEAYSGGEITLTYTGDDGTEVGSGSGTGNPFMISSFFDIFTDLTVDTSPWQSQDHATSDGSQVNTNGSVDLPGTPLPTTLLGGGALLAGLALLRFRRAARERK